MRIDIQKMREELMAEWPWESMQRRIQALSDMEILRAYTSIREPVRVQRAHTRPQPFYEQMRLNI